MITPSLRRLIGRRVRRPALILGLAGALVLPGCQSSTEPSAPPASPASAAASATESPPVESVPADGRGETSVFDLAIGDCFSVTGEQADSVLVVDCGDPHLFEVFALVDHEAGDGEAFPGDDAIRGYGDEACRPAFTDYVGHEYETSVYWITTLTPSDDTWPAGDREIVCLLRLGEGGEETIGSAEGSGQ